MALPEVGSGGEPVARLEGTDRRLPLFLRRAAQEVAAATVMPALQRGPANRRAG